MENKTVSKKVPIILAAVYAAIAVGIELLSIILKATGSQWVFASEKTEAIFYLAQVAFFIGWMAIIRILSKKAQIKWLKILSTVLLIFYCVGEVLLFISYFVIG